MMQGIVNTANNNAQAKTVSMMSSAAKSGIRIIRPTTPAIPCKYPINFDFVFLDSLTHLISLSSGYLRQLSYVAKAIIIPTKSVMKRRTIGRKMNRTIN